MPIDYKLYHPKWSLIVRLIRRRSGDLCELCGVPNRALIYRPVKGSPEWRHVPEGHQADALLQDGIRPVKVVLTTAHWDGDRNNNRFDNLKHACQRCHLNHDREQHARSRKYGRNHKRSQLNIF